MVGLLVFLTVASQATPRRTGDLPFYVDVASVPGAADQSRTRLYFQIPLGGILVTTPTGGLYVTAEFTGRTGDPISDGRVYRDLSGSDRGGELFFEPMLTFTLRPGEFKVRVRVQDLETERSGEVRFEVDVPDFRGEELAVSDLLFGICSETSDSQEGLEDSVRPHPTRRYGDRLPTACVSLRVVDHLEEGADSSYGVRYEVKDRTGQKVGEGSLTAPRGKPIVLRPSIANLGHGEYKLRVEVRLGDKKVRREGRFEVDETRPSFLGDFEQLRTVLGYVATNRELTTLEEARDDSLAAYWRRFWARRDPTPGTDYNEALSEFLRRVDHATRIFGAMEPGWASDMGRIYIKYGDPDRVEEVQSEAFQSPTRIWYYDDRPLSFVFQDVNGFGLYRLAGRRD
jgi:GWxTD domain-containing protein